MQGLFGAQWNRVPVWRVERVPEVSNRGCKRTAGVFTDPPRPRECVYACKGRENWHRELGQGSTCGILAEVGPVDTSK